MGITIVTIQRRVIHPSCPIAARLVPRRAHRYTNLDLEIYDYLDYVLNYLGAYLGNQLLVITV